MIKITAFFLTIVPRRAFAIALLLASLISLTSAQTRSVTDGSTPLALTPGAPAGSYRLNGFDNINPYNGALNFSLPLVGAGGRGGAQYTMMLPIEQHWRVRHLGNPQTSVSHVPEYNGWSGIQPGYSPGVVQGRQVNRSECAQGLPSTTTLTRLTFTAPDGTEYELRDQNSGGRAQSSSCNSTVPGYSRGTIFVAEDGTAATFISDSIIYDWNGSSGSRLIYPTGYLVLSDGTRYRILDGRITWLRDRNGNLLTFSTTSGVTTITDSLNRQITVTPNFSDVAPYGLCDKITYNGFGGTQRTIRISKTTLNNVLRTGYTLQTYAQLFPELNGSSSTPFNPTVVSAVWLADSDGVTRRYQFFYSSYGELARVVLPTGGAYEYDYAAGLVNGPSSGVIYVSGWDGSGSTEIYRRIIERRTYADGVTLQGKMTYSRPEDNVGGNLGYVVMDYLNSAGALMAREKHYYYGKATSSFNVDSLGYSPWKEGREYQTETIDTNGTTVLQRLARIWQQAAGSWSNADTDPSHNPRIIETTTTLTSTNQVARQTFTYDQYNNKTDVYEYDFGVGASPTYPARHTHTDYLSTNVVNGQTYNYQTDTSIHLRSLPSRTKVYAVNISTGAETLFSDSANAYDQSALTDDPGIFGMDAGFTSAYLRRGNITRTSRWLNTTNTWINSDVQYDVAGNVVGVTDPRGNVTQTEYSVSFQYAYPTRITSPIPDTGNNFCSTTALQTFTNYDYSTGLVTSTTDANNQLTTIEYSDVLDRPTRIVRPTGGGSTTYTYNDVAGSLWVRTQTTQSASVTQDSYQFYDNMGRPYRSFQYENSDPSKVWLTSDTQYDAMNRVWRVSSNAYRSSGGGSAINPSGTWTTTAYDALGRVTSVTTFDNAVVTTSYSGNQATVTDQAGKKRRSVTDALGRLAQIIEDPNGLAYQTDYTYDAQGNLRKVLQGTQSRYFMYDSLSRLIRARNPEQSVNANLALTDAVTGNAQWSSSYSYDNNGNLSTKTDARNITATYTYDNINRNTAINYSDGPIIHHIYDSATNGRGRSRGVFYYANTGANSQTTINNYDAMGQPLDQLQYFATGGGWGTPYTVSRTYDLAGHVVSQTYPSGRTVSYSYDVAGRTATFAGNLGDSVSRTYMTAVAFDDSGRMIREQFGTDTPLYNKRHWNRRGQLYDMRLSSVNDDSNWNRGAIVNYYSLANYCFGDNCTGTDTNGNLQIQQSYISNDDTMSSYSLMQQNYAYDGLNRITWVGEYINGSGSTPSGAQSYSYDRWGNRTIDATTLGTGINAKQFTVDAGTNRLGVPSGQGGAMSYDANGNLLNDTYTSFGSRTYDAESRMLTAFDSGGGQSIYTYDADGKRVRRQTGGQETWYVYGLEGELLAEYAASAGPASPQKEYGYRNGELLITAAAAQGSQRTNFALASNGGVATASSTYSGSSCSVCPASAAINGDRKGITWGNGGGWNDAAPGFTFPDWLQVDFNGTKTIDEIDIYNIQDIHWNPSEPTSTMTFSYYGLSGFDVQYWNGSSWVTVPGGSVTGNNLVWRKFTFAPITTSKIRILTNASPDGYSRLIEVEAYGTAGTTTPRINAALSTNGGVATASSTCSAPTCSSCPASAVINGDRKGITWDNGGGWNDAAPGFTFPDWLQVDFNGTKTIDEIDVYNIQDVYWNPIEPPSTMTFNYYGLLGFEVQYWNGSAWVTIPGGSVSNNHLVWVKFTFAPITTSKIRVLTNASPDGYSRLIEVEAWTVGTTGGGSGADVKWMVTDQLGTPRIIADKSGSRSAMTRHDYLPFGEELVAGSGNRTTAQGYVADGVRQKFTSKERDSETGLDYFLARYYSSTQGRFTSPDEFNGGAEELFSFADKAAANPTFYADLTNPQSLNKYQYAFNNPLRYVDPDGHDGDEITGYLPFNPLFPTVDRKTAEDTVTLIKQGATTVIDGANRVIDHPADTALRAVTTLGIIITVVTTPASGPAAQTGTPPSQQSQPLPPPPMEVRGSNKLGPVPDAQGPHTTFKTDPQTGKVTGYETWKPDPRSPSGFGSRKRVDVKPGGRPHTNQKTGQRVPTPHAQGKRIPGGVRPARKNELPK